MFNGYRKTLSTIIWLLIFSIIKLQDSQQNSNNKTFHGINKNWKYKENGVIKKYIFQLEIWNDVGFWNILKYTLNNSDDSSGRLISPVRKAEILL